MSIVRLRRVVLCGLVAEKVDVLEGLQEAGCLHLIPLNPSPSEPETLPAARPEDAYRALKYLADCPAKRRQVRMDDSFNMTDVVGLALANLRRAREVSDRRDSLAHRIAEVAPWGDFVLPPREKLAGLRLWFYRVPHYKMRQVRISDLVWQVVYRDNRHCYTVVIAREEPPAQAMPVPRTHTGSVSLKELRWHLEQCEMQLEELAAEREALTRWIVLLSRNLASAEDRTALAQAARQTLECDEVFAVQGWIPVRDLPRIQAFADERGLALLSEEPGPGEIPPTLLDNPESVAGGEEVVAFYQMPGYRSWDPSRVIFFSLALFFAMILSDAGYALLFALLLVALHYRLGRTRAGRRLRTMGWAIAGLSVAYGILAGGYFGFPPPRGSWLATLRVLDVNDFDAMMRVAVVVGVAHLGIANAVTAWRGRGRPSAAASLGWVAVLTGGLLLWLGMDTGRWLLGSGLAGVFLFSSERRFVKPIDALWRGLDGLLALAGVSKAFGDVLSYLRLFALGLASASLAVTFNQLAFGMLGTVPGLGVLLCILILVLGHALNFVLCVMSGVVHGLRLNLIEFYNWGISEEGYPFKPFSKKEIGTWTT